MNESEMNGQLFAEDNAAQGEEAAQIGADGAGAEHSGEQFGERIQKQLPAAGAQSGEREEFALDARTERAIRALIDGRLREREQERRTSDGAERLRQEVDMYAQQREREERAAFGELVRQADQMRERGFPKFDLAQQMENPEFRRMVLPRSMRGAGLTVEQAYAATHYRDMLAAGMMAAEEAARRSVANSIRSGSVRPQENGAATERSAQVEIDPAKLKREDFLELSRRAAQGEKIAF